MACAAKICSGKFDRKMQESPTALFVLQGQISRISAGSFLTLSLIQLSALENLHPHFHSTCRYGLKELLVMGSCFHSGVCRTDIYLVK